MAACGRRLNFTARAILQDSHMRAVITNEPFPSAFSGQQGGYLQSPTGNMYFPRQSANRKNTAKRHMEISFNKKLNLGYIIKQTFASRILILTKFKK